MKPCIFGWLAIATMLTALNMSIAVAQQNPGSTSNSVHGVVTILDRAGNALSDRSGVVVFVDGLPQDPQRSVTKDVPEISHKGRQFSPSVLPVVNGTTVDFLNDDDIYHNVFSLSEANTFDLGIYPVGTSKLVEFNRPGLVKIYCNIHPNMSSSILVLNNDLFATTAQDGTFEIRNIPDGRYTLRVWSEFSDEQDKSVHFAGGERTEAAFTVRETKRRLPHLNKFGQRYREKY